jgi:TFIIF-interacting CTD phosphatase-like protein
LPDKVNKNALTLFLELDDTLLHTYIYDENFGFMADPAAKDPEYKFTYGEFNIPINVYIRDHCQEFIEFLKENKNTIEPIIYTSGVADYTTKILNLIDPKKEVFQHCLF